MVKLLIKILFGLVLVSFAAFMLLFFQPDLEKEDLTAYISSESEFMELSTGAVAHYRDEGNPDGPVIVFIHGGLDSLHTWEPWVQNLKQDYRIIRMDLPAHGLTGLVPDHDYSRGSFVRFINEVLSRLDVERFTIVGHSMGGGVVTRYALDYPEQLEALINVAGGGIEGYRDAEFLFAAHNVPLLSRYVFRWMGPSLDEMEEIMQQITGPDAGAVISEEHLGALAEATRYKGNRYAQYLMYSKGPWGDYGQYYKEAGPKDLEPRLGEIKVPTLLLWGEKDPLVPVLAGERFNQGIAGSRLIIYKGVGHMIAEEKPEQGAADIVAFLRDNQLDAESRQRSDVDTSANNNDNGVTVETE